MEKSMFFLIPEMLSKTYVMGLKKLPDHFKVKSLLLVTLSKENIVLRMVILRRYQRCTLFRFCLFYLSFFYIQAWSFLYTGIKENTSVLRGKNPICDCFRCNHMPKGSRKKYYTLYSINVKARVKTHYLICFRHYLTRSRANIKSNFLFPSKKKLFPSFARSMFWVTMSNISTMIFICLSARHRRRCSISQQTFPSFICLSVGHRRWCSISQQTFPP
mgnify:CR=1 FL=1